LLLLPTDHPRPPRQTFVGAVQSASLSKELSAALAELSRQEGVTLFMTLLAAFQTLLSRYSGQEDINVGTFVAGRTQAETADLIGFFINNLVLRTDLAGNPRVRELLVRVREVTLEAYAHQDVPFEQVVQHLHVQRNPSYTPLFQVMLVLQNMSLPHLELPGLVVHDLGTETTRSDFDLTLWLADGPDGLSMKLQYNTALFEGGSITRMLDHFQRLLEGIVADPEARLLDLPLLTPAEEADALAQGTETTDLPEAEIAPAACAWPATPEDASGPASGLREEIAGTCAELLAVQKIDVEIDIFRDVSFARRVVRHLSSAFGVDLSLGAVQGAATIARLAHLVEDRLIEQAAPDVLAAMLAEVENEVSNGGHHANGG
jgi:non-ribosomal peptide synthetase component F